MSAEIEEMKRLLTYANYRKVGDALGVSRATVSEWARGNDVNPTRLRQVRALIRGTLRETQKKPVPAPAGTGSSPPDWAKQLTEDVLREVRVNRAVVSAALAGLDPDRVNQILARLEAELGPRAR